MQDAKRIYRSREQRVLAGVCGGLGEYFGIDPVLVRLVWVLGTLVTAGVGVIGYAIAWLIVPERPLGTVA